ncbi:pseudaminic acid cytidylyltransferase [Helicobacter turcicus]|uniref:Pseudaminic acid cytidylyltransferase n=1 Tax=Helicobacter turcicus TaxID=2867412 RepID=A0ABS7JLY7_9HELI|nr:pseudaminic acid cytidylyltransferase [Helicobacter turcicus]MBX7490408.1 pseudaminic acid cytidylyltransferase [Helicobacter turcicus]MBX7545266.1 pseudaminic acid cytidylyltransferase [Helicobacter turcicus]
MQDCICVIPARGGSKRILRKNLKDFCGKPILAYSVENALKSEIFSKVIVSSDDTEILEYAKTLGATPLKRPESLSDDYTATREVILHVIDSINTESWVCCLYATAPLLDFNTLKNAFLLAQKNAQDCYCFSVVEYDYSPFRAFTITENKNKMLFKEYFAKRSQDLKKVYHDAGQFYFARAEIWKEKENIFENSFSFILPQSQVQDIDTLEDWNFAELKYKILKQN